MSDFVRQNAQRTNFNSSESWIILSSIELSIKKKIEALGKPLKDWDINIYRGILTGYNDAFVISTEMRNEILANCQSEEERDRTAELIRPILRGRDIKRYGYEWAELWLIATFPSKNYDIERYPALKNYLLSFAKDILVENGFSWVAESHLAEYCRKRLEQSGEKIYIDGRVVSFSKNESARKKTSNKWFETQDSISYWDDFSKPKIVWKRIGSILRFAYDERGCFGLDSTCFATGENIDYLCCVLNSLMGHYLLKDAPKTGTGDLLISVQAIEPIKIPYNSHLVGQLSELLRTQLFCYTENYDDIINDIVFSMYGLSNEEREYVTRFINEY